MLELDCPIPVMTPLGEGMGIVIIDRNVHMNTCWIVILIETGEIRHFDANDLIVVTNYTFGINLPQA